MKILAFPRDPNPYQELLYTEMRRFGVQVRYLGRLTPSHTVNVLLLPAEMAFRRACGNRIVHLHWVFGFSLPGGDRFLTCRRLAQAWFRLWLRVARLLGVHIIWTAHNVLPHAPVFADDAAARRTLVNHCDLVLAHSQATLSGLAELGAVPRQTLLVRHGPIGPAAPLELRAPGSGPGPREFLFFGKIAAYKGIEELIAAFGDLPEGISARLTIAGQCDDAGLRELLASAPDIRVRLEHIPEAEVAAILASADVVVLPFREVTTSGSAELALSHARPLIVPDLPGLTGLPPNAVVRYDGSVRQLTAAIAELATAGSARLAVMSAAAAHYSAQASWAEIARTTVSAMGSVVSGLNGPAHSGIPVSV